MTPRLQIGHDDRVIGEIADEARALVGDDAVHVAVRMDTYEHLPERDALGHLRGGAAWLGVLCTNPRPRASALRSQEMRCGNRDTLAVVVGVHLALAGNAQVDDSSAARCRQRQARVACRRGEGSGSGRLMVTLPPVRAARHREMCLAVERVAMRERRPAIDRAGPES